MYLWRMIGCLMLVTFTLTGCQTGAPKTLSLTIPTTKTVSADSVPWHARLAVDALVARLSGASDPEAEPKKVAQGNDVAEPAPGFSFDGFTVQQITFSRVVELDGQTPGRLVAGFLHFRDDAGRRASVSFKANYLVAKAAITMERASWSPAFSAFPKVVMHVLPSTSIKDIVTAAGDSYRNFYSAVQKAAVRLNDPKAVPKEPRDYVIVVTLKDRIAPDAKFDVQISNSKQGAKGYKEATRYRRYDDGWVVALVSGRFALTSDTAFWTKAVFTPGTDVPKAKRSERVIGLFSTGPGKIQAAGS